ncbi:MAG: hypothetical protein JEY96_16965 [Bacteroidales bacterium]|nr:hypothetical protein [Bacteroidales bacterium]
MIAIIKTGAKMLKGLFNKNKMDINLDNTVDKAGDIIQSASNKEQGTRRLNIDMLSDSWLSKNIRPIILIWLMSLFTFIFIGKACGLDLDIAQGQTIGTLLLMAVGFYFPMRSAEKYLKKRSKNL